MGRRGLTGRRGLKQLNPTPTAPRAIVSTKEPLVDTPFNVDSPANGDSPDGSSPASCEARLKLLSDRAIMKLTRRSFAPQNNLCNAPAGREVLTNVSSGTKA